MGDANFYRAQRDRCSNLADASKVPAVATRLRALAMQYHIKSAQAPEAPEPRLQPRIVRPPEPVFGRNLDKAG